MPPTAALAEEKPNPKVEIGISAKVNGRVITKSEVAILLAPIRARLDERFPEGGPEHERLLKESQKDVLKELIDRRILIDQFNQPPVQIAPEEVQAEVQREIRDNYQGNADKLREALKASRMTVDGFRSLLRDRLIAKELQMRQAKKK